MKGVLENKSPVVKLLLLLTLMLVGLLASAFMIRAFSLHPENDIKMAQALAVCGIFILPALLAAILCSRRPVADYYATQPLSRKNVKRIIAASLTLLPCINLIHYYNKMLRLPSWMSGIEKWMQDAEAAAEQAMELLLKADSLGGLAINIVIVAILAALSEEFIFRGLLFKWLRDTISNLHWVVWITAILFSAIHLQFYGFIPRLLLGAWLGYLLIWTGSLWAPILAHFANNLMGVLLYYRYADSDEEFMMEVGTGSTLWFSIAGAIIFTAIARKIWEERVDG